MHDLFRQFAQLVSRAVGSIWAFLIFIILVLTTGYWSDFSSRWEDNISFIIAVTALSCLFFLQKSQQHSDTAAQLKLDELIRARKRAHDEIISVEIRAEEELEKLREL